MKRLLMASVAALTLTGSMTYAQAPMAPAAKTEVTRTQASVTRVKALTNEADFRAALIGPGTMSLASSKLALNKASNPKVKEFAMFETDEQTAIGMVLKELNTPDAPMTAKDAAMKQKLASTTGRAFDKNYVMAQMDGHQALLTIVESYLNNADMHSMDPKEMEARHLAYVMRATIKQHLANVSELMAIMK